MGRVYRRRRFYSTRDRILVHLSSDGAEQAEKLTILTQEGIAESILSGRSTVTKWLGRLEADGLIVGGREHVPGHRIRKTVSRLTPNGCDVARRVRERLVDDAVEVRAPGLDPVTIRVADLPNLFPTRLDLTLAVSLVSERRLDLTGLPESRTAGRAPLVWGPSLRRPSRVLGRSEELAALDSWHASPSQVLTVVGLAGIGKTSLVGQWILARRQTGYVFWYDLNESSTLAMVIADLASFLSRLGRRRLSTYLSESSVIDRAVVGRTLTHELRGLSLLCVLDGFERVRPRLARDLAATFLPVTESAQTKLLVTSRTIPKFVTDLNLREPDTTLVLRLGALDARASVDLLRSKGMAGDDTVLLRIAASARGHPLLLSLVAQGGAAKHGPIQKYLDTEIWTSLTPAERTALEAAAMFRRAVAREALASLPGVTNAVLDSLQVKSLIEPTVTGG
ncbi:MAG: hypothetical protein ACREDF_01290, partial [Thermoplasmata archaeon]